MFSSMYKSKPLNPCSVLQMTNKGEELERIKRGRVTDL